MDIIYEVNINTYNTVRQRVSTLLFTTGYKNTTLILLLGTTILKRMFI